MEVPARRLQPAPGVGRPQTKGAFAPTPPPGRIGCAGQGPPRTPSLTTEAPPGTVEKEHTMSKDMPPEKLKEFLASEKEADAVIAESEQLANEAEQRGPKDELQGRNR